MRSINEADFDHCHLWGMKRGLAFNYVQLCGEYVIPVAWDIAMSRPGQGTSKKNQYNWSSGGTSHVPNPKNVNRHELLKLELTKP